jgi:PiT family inorganic phosphate transporter
LGRDGKTVLFLILAPGIGALLGMTIGTIVFRLVRRWTPARVDRFFRRGQLVSAALYSLGHGGNDAQKTMGVIFALLIAAGRDGGFATPEAVPIEVVLACHAAMALGTLSGGWRIVRTMGQRLLRLRPVDGFCAETAGATTLALTILGGIPASTTQTIAGAIVGVGSLRRVRAVRWNVALRMAWAWAATMPLVAILAAAIWWLLAGLSRLWI